MTSSAANSGLSIGPGTRVGKCDVIEQIGRGGMGAVFRAKHATLHIDVALKVITFGAASPEEREEYVARFFREARSAARVRHENIVSVLDVDEDKGVHYMVLEFVAGASAKRLIDGGPLDPEEAARIARDAARALAAAHRMGIVHRDVKPENILLTADGRVKVSDFGIAHTHSDVDPKLTRTGQVVGTPHYMSPEQVEGNALDGRADIYSLGATLYHLATGTLPYSGSSALMVCMKHVTEALPPPRTRNPAIPEGLDRVIVKMMAKRPDDRYRDGDEVAAALEPFAGKPKPPEDRLRTQPVPASSPKGPVIVTPGRTDVGPGDRTQPVPEAGAHTPAAHQAPPSAPPTPLATPAPLVVPQVHAQITIPSPSRTFRGIGCQVAITFGVVAVAFVTFLEMQKRGMVGGPGVGTGGLGAAPAASSEGAPVARVAPDAAPPVAAATPTPAPPVPLPAPPALPEPPPKPAVVIPDQKKIEAMSNLLSKAYDAMGAGRNDEAARGFDEVVVQAGDSKELVFRQFAIGALYTGAMLRERSGDPTGALERAETLVESYPEAAEQILGEARKMIARLSTSGAAQPASIEVSRVLVCERGAERIVAADIDADRRPDILVLGGSPLLFLTRGASSASSYVPRESWTSPPPNGGLRGAADLDRSGVAAFFSGTRQSGNGIVSVWRMDATTGAARSEEVKPGPRLDATNRDPKYVDGADFDGDGATDLLLWTPDEAEIYARRGGDVGGRMTPHERGGAPEGGFGEERAIALGGKIEELRIGDVTGDKRDDIILLQHDLRKQQIVSLVVYAADEKFNFTPLPPLQKGDASWWTLAVGDFTGDGTADILATSTADHRVLSVYRSRGKGIFELAPSSLQFAFVPWGSVLADVNGDGKADFLAVERAGSASSLYTLLSQGDGSFKASQRVELGNLEDVRIVVPADLDQDGKIDVALFDYYHSLGILYGDGTGKFGNKR